MRLLCFLLCLILFPSIVAAERCAPLLPDPLTGFAPMDPMMFLDLPDPDTTRAVNTFEDSFTSRMVAGEISGFIKRWCQIGITSFIVEIEVPVEDDAVAAQITRAIYEWTPTEDPVGWQIHALGERFRCARGDDPFAEVCP